MRRLSTLLGTLCGIGYVPVAPGTAASVVAAGVWYGWHPSAAVQWLVCGVAIVAGVWAAGDIAKRAQGTDPSQVVIDEFAGMWVALAGLPRNLPLVCIALFLFRVFDIVKSPPIKRLERLPGGVGIVLDDIAAGIFTRALLSLGLSLGAF